MHVRTVRQTSVTLPDLDDADLDVVGSLEGKDGTLRGFRLDDVSLRDLPLSGTQLTDGRVTGLATGRAFLNDLRLHSVEFSRCDLSGLRWTDSRLSRVTFTDCKLLGSTWEQAALDDVVFTSCRLDYAAFTRLRATGSVIFNRCSLQEARFGGCDLRGNDLSGLRGASTLRQVTIDRSQLPDLAEALATELEITFG
ncbi:pentapeptide repeat-containing protein [Streptosporangium saharense]|uniref:pentapeptide repeat-containing protein n=1 Tax=Streptosporangium saharense TaxID=1706840 RepID=UPI003417FE28